MSTPAPMIAKYQLVAELGRGGMGTVYRARDSVLGREVALKVMRTGTGMDQEMRERFYREAQASAQLHHPNLVTVYDMGEADGVLYIAMELLAGLDLRQFIAARHALALPLRLELIAQASDALAHAHKHQIVHRDIKPSNLFIASDRRMRVLDFGIARLPSSALTMAGRVLGTPHYMAPEQLLGRPVDGRADLFSLAVVCFEFISFDHPFHSENVVNRIAQGEPDRLEDHLPEASPALARLLERAMAKAPEDRHQTGAEFAAALRAVAQERSGATTGVGVSTTIGLDKVLRDLEAALQRGDLASANTLLHEAEQAAGADPHRQAALHTYRERLRQTTVGASSAPGGTAAAVEQATPPQGSTPLPDPPVPLDDPALPPGPPPRRRVPQAVVLGGLGVATLAAVIAGGLLWMQRGPKPRPQRPDPLTNERRDPQPAVIVLAEATVQAQDAVLQAGPGTGETVAALERGMAVQLLEEPAGPDAWVRARLADPARQRVTGYVRAADLGAWTASDAERAWTLLSRFTLPDASAVPAPERLEALSRFRTAHPQSPRAAEAHLTEARLRLALSRDERVPAAERAAHRQQAQQALEQAAATPALAADVAALQKELAGPARPPELLPVPVVLQQVSQAFNAARYSTAERLVRHILAREPQNADALQWQGRIQRAKELEGLK